MTGKYQRLKERLRREQRLAVAFSGGVDSSFLLATARQVLGTRVLAVHADSCLLPRAEQQRVAELAARFGCRLDRLSLEPLSWPAFVANPPDRCYLCKKAIFSRFHAAAAREGALLADGTNADDLLEDRPGLKALAELGVASPLAEAGLTKAEIRELSRKMGLPTWDQPPASCLATRIPSGEPITREKLEMVARCEEFLHQLGFCGCRARLFPDYLVIEVRESDFFRLCRPENRRKIVAFGVGQGMDAVYLHPRGR